MIANDLREARCVKESGFFLKQPTITPNLNENETIEDNIPITTIVVIATKPNT